MNGIQNYRRLASDRAVGAMLMLLGALLVFAFSALIPAVPAAGMGVSFAIAGSARLLVLRNALRQGNFDDNLRIIDKFLLSFAAVSLSADVLLAIFGEADLGVYFIANAIAFLILTLARYDAPPAMRSSLNALASILFCGFVLTLALKVASIMAR